MSGSVTTCPACAEPVKGDDSRCPHCGERLLAQVEPYGEEAGRGSRTAATVIGCALAACCLLSGAVVLPNVIDAKQTGNESSAIGSLRAIGAGQLQFRLRATGAAGMTPPCGTLADLGTAGLIDPLLAAGRKNGYSFDCQPAPLATAGFAATAAPLNPGTTGSRYFGMDPAGAIYASDTAPFSARGGILSSPPDAVALSR